MRTQYLRIPLACALAALLSACGSSGGSGPLPAQSTSPPVTTQSANVEFTFTIPALASASSATSSSVRRPMDFTASTQSVTVAIGTRVLETADVSAASPICKTSSSGRSCTVGVNAPSGTDQFIVTAYDQANGAGNAIAQATVQATTSAQPSPINVVVTGTITKLELQLSNPYPPVGTAASTTVTVTGLDADGNVVLGSFASPVTLQDSDTSGATLLSTTTVTSAADPAKPITLSYNGAQPFTSATITASLSGVASASTTFAPAPAFLKTYVLPNAPGFFPRPPGPQNIAKGPDGNMWIAATVYAELLKVAPDGSMTVYPVPNPGSRLQGLVVGSDGNLWFAESGNSAIGKMTTSGTVTEYPLPSTSDVPVDVTLGKDGNIWYAEQQYDSSGNLTALVGSITPAGTITEYPLPANTYPQNLTSGPDGNIWIADSGNNVILKVSMSGQVLGSYPTPTAKAEPWGIAAGTDGNVWFTEFAVGKIGRITPSGSITEFAIPTGSANPLAITAGPDGKMWFSEMGAEAGVGKIGYVALDGSQIRDFFGDGLHVHDLAFDSNGTLWYVAAQMPFGTQEVGTFAY